MQTGPSLRDPPDGAPRPPGGSRPPVWEPLGYGLSTRVITSAGGRASYVLMKVSP